jgi:hypothetical protein
MHILPLEIAGWGLVTLIGVLVLPTILGWLPIIFDFLVNFTWWLIWVLKYRQSK